MDILAFHNPEQRNAALFLLSLVTVTVMVAKMNEPLNLIPLFLALIIFSPLWDVIPPLLLPYMPFVLVCCTVIYNVTRVAMYLINRK